MKPSLGMWRECHPTFQLTKHCDYRSRHHSVDDLTVIGSPAPPATAGSTNSARTISAHLLTYGEQPSSVVTLERRYGPRRLRDDDDDDDDVDTTCRRLCHTSAVALLYATTLCNLLLLTTSQTSLSLVVDCRSYNRHFLTVLRSDTRHRLTSSTTFFIHG